MLLSQVREAMHNEGVMASELRASGIYVWVNERGEILYIGESSGVAKRTRHEASWRDAFAKGTITQSLWEAAGCGLAAVLAHAGASDCYAWALDAADRKSHQNALIRLSALMGSTPPAQGAGWDYGAGKSAADVAASDVLWDWFADGHAVRALTEEARGAIASRAAMSASKAPRS